MSGKDEATRPTKQWTAAGGVPVRWVNGRLEVLVIHHRGQGLWRLPKGRVEPGESLEETARRETAEETGLQVEVGPQIARSSYEYRSPKTGAWQAKTVHHFLLWPRADVPVEREKRFDATRWVSPEEAIELLHYDNERAAVQAAVETATRRRGE